MAYVWPGIAAAGCPRAVFDVITRYQIMRQEAEFLGPHPMMEPLEAAAAQAIIRRRAGLGAALAGRSALQVRFLVYAGLRSTIRGRVSDACHLEVHLLESVLH